jgi:hypothetical protein
MQPIISSQAIFAELPVLLSIIIGGGCKIAVKRKWLLIKMKGEKIFYTRRDCGTALRAALKNMHMDNMSPTEWQRLDLLHTVLQLPFIGWPASR